MDESVIVVHIGALGESLEDPTSLVLVQGTIRIELMLEDQLASHNIGSRGPKYQVPSAV
jgi:hypothetical protein